MLCIYLSISLSLYIYIYIYIYMYIRYRAGLRGQMPAIERRPWDAVAIDLCTNI